MVSLSLASSCRLPYWFSFWLLPFTVVVQFTCGAFQHLYQVWGQAGAAHAVLHIFHFFRFSMFTFCLMTFASSFVVQTSIIQFSSASGAHVLKFLQFCILQFSIRLDSDVQFLAALRPFLHSVFIQFFQFSILIDSNFRSSGGGGCLFGGSSKGQIRNSSSSNRFVHHPVPFFPASRQGSSVCKIPRPHHWNCSDTLQLLLRVCCRQLGHLSVVSAVGSCFASFFLLFNFHDFCGAVRYFSFQVLSLSFRFSSSCSFPSCSSSCRTSCRFSNSLFSGAVHLHFFIPLASVFAVPLTVRFSARRTRWAWLPTRAAQWTDSEPGCGCHVYC